MTHEHVWVEGEVTSGPTMVGERLTVCAICGTALVHLKHFKDGYPLCWPMDRDGEFSGTFIEEQVTCPDCKSLGTQP